MRKAAHHSGGVVSSNPRRWRGEQLHHHGGGVCLLFVLLWMDSWHHETIVWKKWYKNNPKEGLCGVTFWPTLACTTPYPWSPFPWRFLWWPKSGTGCSCWDRWNVHSLQLMPISLCLGSWQARAPLQPSSLESPQTIAVYGNRILSSLLRKDLTILWWCGCVRIFLCKHTPSWRWPGHRLWYRIWWWGRF